MTPATTLRKGQAVPFVALDRFLVPAGAPEIIGYFLDRLYVSHGLRERLLRIVLKARTLRGRGRQRLRGRSLLFRDGSWDWNGDFETVDAEAVKVWRRALSLLRESPIPRQLLRQIGMREVPLHRTILLRDYPSAGRARLLLFPFPEGSSRPAAVIKLKSHAGGGRSLRDERDALSWVRSRVNDPEFLRSIPEPLEFQNTPDVEVLILSHLDGRTAYWDQQNRLVPGRQTLGHMKAAADWMVAFHRACGTRALSGSGPSHGDFWSRNLLIPSLRESRQETLPFVVDWESFDPSGPASFDLFHFPLTYLENHPWDTYGRLSLPEAFHKGLIAPGPVSKAIEGYFSRYCSGVGLDPDELDGLFREHIRSRARTSREPQREAWQQCLELLDYWPSAVSRCAR